jgi:hypothetical protein
MFTQLKLKEILKYNPKTGVFSWLNPLSNRVCCGDNAGFIGKETGYRLIGLFGKTYQAHRVAWFYIYNEWPKFIDHINHDRADNRMLNLREVTHSENLKNQKMRATNTSGITGVYWNKEKKKWDSKITVDYESISLGRFNDKFEAICARKSANNKYGFHANHGAKA